MKKQKILNTWAYSLSLLIIALGMSVLIAGVGFQQIPAVTEWAGSGHADDTSEAFLHWGPIDGNPLEDPCAVQGSCARCHTAYGFMGFVGESLPPGIITNQAAVLECIGCHNDSAVVLDSVMFPSGAVITDLGPEARCLQCHQGRESTDSVNTYIADKGAVEDDTVYGSLGFRNVHYFATGATLYGNQARGGYQYDGQAYEHKFAHVEGIDTCVDCHNPHSLELELEVCAICHDAGADSVFTVADLYDARLAGSLEDYDGDGDITEGIFYEVEGLKDILYSTIREYARTVTVPLTYDSHAYPYFFLDFNDNDAVDDGEGSYNAWTPRLLRVAYNYQYSQKDPGGFAHNGKYVIQLLFDSIEDLDTALVIGMHRDDPGHFHSSEEAFRHWDGDGEVSAGCARCHSATGLPFYLETGVNIAEPLPSGFYCTTCHDAMPEFTRYHVEAVEFPSGAKLTLSVNPNLPLTQTPEEDRSNLCINCHQGRESTVSINAMVAGKDDDTVTSSVRFRNVHYFGAGATLFGSEAKGAYEYMFKSYNGRFQHVNSLDSCVDCHDPHTLEPDIEYCWTYCHIREPRTIRWQDTNDYDGDGDATEGLYYEIETLGEMLYVGIQDYAANEIGGPLVYDSHAYPYFFKDTNGNGEVDPGEAVRANGYSTWTPRLAKAAYNYQFLLKDPGAYAHNGKYIIQILFDSLEDIGADVSGMVRPVVENSPAKCGDESFPFPRGDMNFDCQVNMIDWALFTVNWLIDSGPGT